MKRILITGFEPFGEHRENPSQIIINGNYKPAIGGIKTKKVVLPNEFDSLEEKYIKLLQTYKPDIIINCGLDSNIFTLKVETVALNISFDHVLDKKLLPINLEQPNALITDIDTTKLTSHLLTKGIVAETSFHAGIYSCNNIYYHSLSWCKKNNSKAVFIHLPYTHEMARNSIVTQEIIKPSLSQQLMENALTEIITFLLNSNKTQQDEKNEPAS